MICLYFFFMICLFPLVKSEKLFFCQNLKWTEISGPKVTNVHHHEFIKKRFKGIGKDSIILSWLVSNVFHVFFLYVRKLGLSVKFAYTFFLSCGNCFLLSLVNFLQKTIHFPFFFSILLVSSFIDQYLNQITPQCVLVLSW